MARCTIAAATAESTPPDSAQIARPSPICSRMRVDLLVDDVDHRPGRAAAGDVEEEVLEHLLAVLGVQHLGVPLDAGQAAVGVLERRDRRDPGRGQHVEPAGARRPRSRRGTSRRCGRPGCRRAACRPVDLDRRPAVLAGAGRRHRAAEALGHQLEAVAHAEHRYAAVEQRRRRAPGRPAAYTDDGPPDSTIAVRLAREHLGHRHRVRHDLGVDLGLAHPPGDQLGVLRPEVDDEDQVVLRHGPSLSRARDTGRSLIGASGGPLDPGQRDRGPGPIGEGGPGPDAERARRAPGHGGSRQGGSSTDGDPTAQRQPRQGGYGARVRPLDEIR